MSTTVPTELVVAAFANEGGADDAMSTLKEAKREHLIKIREAAVVKRGSNGKLHINERHDIGGAGGAGAGAVLGIIASMVSGPLGPLVGTAAGAAAGGATGAIIDRGLDNQQLKQLGEALTPGTSAIVALVEHTWVRDLEAALQQAGAEVTTAAMAADIQAQLAQGRDVAYDALTAGGAAVAGRASAPTSSGTGSA
jgi:uncharacterized membrane protein